MSFDARRFKRLEHAGHDRLGPRYLAPYASAQGYRPSNTVPLVTARPV